LGFAFGMMQYRSPLGSTPVVSFGCSGSALPGGGAVLAATSRVAASVATLRRPSTPARPLLDHARSNDGAAATPCEESAGGGGGDRRDKADVLERDEGARRCSCEEEGARASGGGAEGEAKARAVDECRRNRVVVDSC